MDEPDVIDRVMLDDPPVGGCSDVTVVLPDQRTLEQQIKYLITERARINKLLRELQGLRRSRPQFGPCLRCGHVWFGNGRTLMPKNCPRCHSAGWAMAPERDSARRPTDKPNPRWYKPRPSIRRRTNRDAYYATQRATVPVSQRGLTPPPPSASLSEQLRWHTRHDDAPQPESTAKPVEPAP